MKSLKTILILSMFLVAVVALGPSGSVRTTSALKKAGGSAMPRPQETCLSPVEPVSCDGGGEDLAAETETECNMRFTGPFFLPNPCGGPENFVVDGHLLVHATTNKNSTHMRFHLNMHGESMTTSLGPGAEASPRRGDGSTRLTRVKLVPDKLTFEKTFSRPINLFAGRSTARTALLNVSLQRSATFNFEVNGGVNMGPPPDNSSDPFTALIITQGKDQNYLLHGVIHVTMNAQGQMTASVCFIKMECRGKSVGEGD